MYVWTKSYLNVVTDTEGAEVIAYKNSYVNDSRPYYQ